MVDNQRFVRCVMHLSETRIYFAAHMNSGNRPGEAMWIKLKTWDNGESLALACDESASVGI
jgi:hypothetical protein